VRTIVKRKRHREIDRTLIQDVIKGKVYFPAIHTSLSSKGCVRGYMMEPER